MASSRRPARTLLPTCILAALATAACSLAPAASAEVPSVDAYGGEALVLGSSHRHGHGGGSGTGAGRRGATGGSTGQGSGSATSSSGSSSGSSSHVSGSGGAQAGGRRSATSGGATGQASAGGSEATTGSSGSRPASFADHQAASSSAFGTTDILLLIAGVVCLAALALVLRTVRKPS